MSAAPRFVCIGGTTRAGSSTERALRYAAVLLEEAGGAVDVFAGPDLILPMYSSEDRQRSPVAIRIVEALRAADGVILASPGYHGGFSGLIKNVLDYLEDMADDPAPYLKGRAVGCIASAFGWQAIGTTLLSLRSVVHALGAWPTPTGVSMISTGRLFDEQGRCINEELDEQFRRVIAELFEFARRRQAS
ncbi:MAG: NADPH-dependent FMN reductase [Burkholderiales bacterium]